MENNEIKLEANEKAKQASLAFFDKFDEECDDSVKLNFDLLAEIINDNKDTEYGKKYHFDEIHSYDDYKRLVPIIEYSDIQSYMEKMEKGEQNILTAYPFSHLNLTSGTLGKQKRIPMTTKMMNSFYAYDKLYGDGMLYKLVGDEWTKGRTFAGVQGSMIRLPSGITVGDAEAVMADVVAGGKEEFNNQMSALFTSPVEALICDKENRDYKYLHCLFALLDKDIRGIVFGYLGVLVDFLNFIYLNHKTLIKDIRRGKISNKILIEKDAKRDIEARMKPNPERAKELTEIFANLKDRMFVKKVWPHLCYIRGVGGSTFKVFTERLQNEYIGNDVTYILSGITASEGLFSVPIKANCEDSVLVSKCCFFEFLPVDADGDLSKIVTMDKLEVGKTYELIITNLSGFYRYRIYDCVKVVGYHKKAPIVRYMYRTTNVVNICAEKTTEAALCAAFLEANKELNYPFGEFVVCGNRDDVPAHYDIFLQEKEGEKNYTRKHVEEVFEKYLCIENEEYAEIVGDHFGHLKVLYLPPNATEQYREMRVKQGASPMQCKQIHIIKTKEQKEFFYYLSFLYENEHHHEFINTVFSFANKLDPRIQLLHRATRKISKSKNKKNAHKAFHTDE